MGWRWVEEGQVRTASCCNLGPWLSSRPFSRAAGRAELEHLPRPPDLARRRGLCPPAPTQPGLHRRLSPGSYLGVPSLWSPVPVPPPGAFTTHLGLFLPPTTSSREALSDGRHVGRSPVRLSSGEQRSAERIVGGRGFRAKASHIFLPTRSQISRNYSLYLSAQ